MADALAIPAPIQTPVQTLQPLPPSVSQPNIAGAFSAGNPMEVAGGANPTIGPAAGTNPLSLVSSFAQTAAQISAAKQAAQTTAARQRAGQIMALAPDSATGLAEMMKDPVIAEAPDVMTSTVGTLAALTTQQGDVMKQGRDAYTTVIQNLGPLLADKAAWGPVTQMALSLTPPQSQPAVKQALAQLQEVITAPGRDGKEVTLAEQNKRIADIAISNGLGDSISRLLPATAMADTGPTLQPYTIAPNVGGPNGEAPGSIQLAGPAIKKGLAPTLTDIPNPAGGLTREVVSGAGGSGATLGRTPTTIEAGELGSSAEAAKAITEGVNTFNDTLPVRIKALDTIEDSMSQFQAGGGAPTRGKVAQMAQALENIGLDISPETVDKIGNGSLAGTQLFETQLKPLLVKMLSSDARGSGRVMLPEVETYIHLMDSAKDPRAILAALNNIRYGYQLAFDKSQKWGEYQKSGGDPGAFTTWYNSQLDPAKLPAKAGELRLSPTPMTAVKGGVPATANRPPLAGFFK